MTSHAQPTPDQLRRTALVYIRQSSPGQVVKNTESRELQYELSDRAVTLGWHAEQVVVIDEDLGRRASDDAVNRSGFQRLVAEVGLGHVGLVIGIEVSRLARRNADWYNLMDLCALTNTLIADNDGIYHPGDYNSRLVLGLKGTMAEAELHLIRQRLTAGRHHKAAKGTLRVLLPVGLEYDESDMVILARDASVRAAICEVFSRFAEMTSARQVALSLREDQLKFPRRRPGTAIVTWGEATYRAVHEVLVKPAYAGAFVFGRTRVDKSVDRSGRVVSRSRQVGRQEWEVCIPDHHPGYIDWETYLANQERLRSNQRPRRGEAGGAPREGSALLQGLVRCGQCARMMHVGYSGPSGRYSAYRCDRAAHDVGPAAACQRLGGRRLDEAVVSTVFAALAPASLAATAKALTEAQAEHQRTHVAFEAAVERAQYECERARRQFDAVEPENRLVARGLEGEWESRLAEVSRAEAALAAKRAHRPVSLTSDELAWLERAGADLRAVFDADSTTMAERKQLLRAVLTEVVVTVNGETREAAVRIYFQGGAVVEERIPPGRVGGNRIAATDEDIVELVRRLAEHYDDTRIAQILSRQERKTARGLNFTRERVNALRQGRGIPAGPRVSSDASNGDTTIMSLGEAQCALGVSSQTLYRWLREGFIAGTQLTPGGPWHIPVNDELRAKIVPEIPPGWVRLAEAAQRLGVARQTVLDRIRRGELRAVHVKRGRRSGLAIDLTTTRSPSGRLFT